MLTRDQPGRSPQGPAPLPQPLDKPHPTLAQMGFHGPVSEFNARLQTTHDSYFGVHGVQPPPGMALNIATSSVSKEDIPKLFKAEYNNPDLARLSGVVAQHKAMNPYDNFVMRADGVSQPDNPVRRIVQPLSPAQLQKKYPMVMEGALPIPNLDKVFAALNYLNTPSKPQPSVQDQLQKGYLFGASPGSINPLEAGHGHEVQAQLAVRTIRQAQVELNKQMDTELPVTGTFNQTWTSALQNWMKSADYFHKQALFQSQQDGFGNNLAAYKNAFLSKQKQSSRGLVGHFMAAMPLPLFGHGGFIKGVLDIPSYLTSGSGNPVNIGLHGLMRTAGLTLDVVGGTVTQAKADAAAGTTFAAYMDGLHGKSTYEEALAKSREQLKANPTWMRAFGAGFIPKDEPRWLSTLDFISNIAGDLILLRKPGFTGERVGAGDIEAATNSSHLNAMARWAHQDLLKYGRDGVGRASARLERGEGALQLVTRAAKLVKSGAMSEEQFQQHVAELYATGHTTIGTTDISGSLLHSLRQEKLPTPGLPGRAWLQTKSQLRDWFDSFDAHQGPAGNLATDRSVALMDNLRTAVSHYVPRRSGYFDPNLPEQVFNFTLRHLGDSTLANKLESQVVRFQALNNVQGLRTVERIIQRVYYNKNIGKVIPKDEPFKAVLSTEGPSVFHFPGGGQKELDGAMSRIQGWTQSINRVLNRTASLHARVILAGFNPFSLVGGFSLFWKHAIGDTLRAEAGGGGILSGVSKDVRLAKKEINDLANNDQTISRALGQFRERIVKGETRWALNRGGANVFTRTFKTGENFTKRNYMEAAGGYLRRRLDDPALEPYLQGGRGVPSSFGSWPAREDPLTNLVLHDKNYQGLWRKAQKSNPDLTAENYAALLHAEYAPLEAALQAKGLSFDDAKAFYHSVRGADDTAKLGQWLAKHEVDFEVRGGLVHDVGRFDEVTGRWIANVIMAPNKWNRGRFGENILAKTYSELRAAGWDQKTAFNTAADSAYSMTKYHMLDFANRLQIEQDLRWVSYFATKARLYFKWVLGTFIRHPGYAAAVNDFRQALNSQGGITIPVKVFGSEWQIPAERLVWVPGREYDEMSPLGSTVLDFIRSGGSLEHAIQHSTGTQGNLLTRSDTATILGTKLLKLDTGAMKPSYAYATQGLTKSVADKINRAINEYQMDYLQHHGHYAPVQQAIKIALVHSMALEYWRANMPMPIIPYQPNNAQDQLLAQFESIIDPKARRDFLSKHKGFSDSFGIYQDPNVYLHNQPYFERWTKAMDAYSAARASLYADARKSGQWTPDLEKQRRDLSTALQKQRDQLLIEDAKQSGIDTHGLVPNGSTIPYGTWGKLVNQNPVFDPSHALSALFPKLGKAEQDNVIGPLQYQMQQELNQLNDPKYVASSNYTPEEVKTRKVELLRALDVFRNYPSDALGTVQQSYQTKYVNSYWKESDAKFTAIGLLPTAERNQANAAYRAWRDSQDHPVTVNGITFPSPVKMAWALLDPKTRVQRLSVLASKPVQDLANYELDLLGIKHSPNLSEALSAIATARADFSKAYPGVSANRDRVKSWAQQIDKQAGYQGFYSFYVNTILQPRIRQYEQTTLYQNMPSAIKQEFDSVIGDAAKQVAQGIITNKHSSYYKQEWRNAIKTKIMPWLNAPEQGPLKRFLEPYGPNFLNDLVSTSTP